jgi:outer membrane receptor for ferrienterochelin and colicin
VQGAQTSAGFTQGADAVSLFGMPAGYTKYLIDGRPMVNYPALYNGSDAFNNISGIPIDMVERIEILPGGSSSLYGSDAIAGVINFILKNTWMAASPPFVVAPTPKVVALRSAAVSHTASARSMAA